jgi:tRNA(fMet)-specific endonuclease VapC
MILIDTSAWIDFFRGREPIAEAVDSLLERDQAAICGPVLTELRRGLHNASERAQVLPLLDACHLLVQPDLLWSEAGDLGLVLSKKGATVKTLALLIAVYSLSHGVPLLTTDSDFSQIRKAGVPLLLA